MSPELLWWHGMAFMRRSLGTPSLPCEASMQKIWRSWCRHSQSPYLAPAFGGQAAGTRAIVAAHTDCSGNSGPESTRECRVPNHSAARSVIARQRLPIDAVSGGWFQVYDLSSARVIPVAAAVFSCAEPIERQSTRMPALLTRTPGSPASASARSSLLPPRAFLLSVTQRSRDRRQHRTWGRRRLYLH